MPRLLAHPLAALPLLAALSAARPAAAGDPQPVEVTVTPKGQPWSVGSHSGVGCSPTCTIHLLPDKYLVTIGGAKEEMLLDGPTEITYSPGSPKLRTAGGWMAIGGVGSGGLLLGLGIYGYVKSCSASTGCTSLPPISKTASLVLVSTAAVMISISVTGAILFAVSGESLTARDLAPRRAPARSFDVVLNPSTLGGTVDVVGRF